MGRVHGEYISENMVRSRSLLLLLAALASTVVAATTSADWKRGLDAIVTKLQTNDDASALVQDVDTLVPENRDPLEVADESPAKLAAREVTTMLQQGKKQDECEKLADDLCKTVSEKVRIFDEQIEDLSDGSDCKDKGQLLVKKTTQEVNTLEITLKTRTEEAAKLANAGVDFGTYPLNTLDESECGQFWQDDAYVKAKQASQNAAELVTETSTELTTLKLQLKEAIERAEEKRTECECDVRAAYNSLYISATSTAGEDAAAYAKCKHMKCFLKTKNSEQCLNLKFVVPTVSQEKKFAQGVPENTVFCAQDNKTGDSSGSGYSTSSTTTSTTSETTSSSSFETFSENLSDEFDSDEDEDIPTPPPTPAAILVRQSAQGCNAIQKDLRIKASQLRFQVIKIH